MKLSANTNIFFFCMYVDFEKLFLSYESLTELAKKPFENHMSPDPELLITGYCMTYFKILSEKKKTKLFGQTNILMAEHTVYIPFLLVSF